MLSCSLVISNGIPNLIVFIFDKVILKCREIEALEALPIVEVNITVVVVGLLVIIIVEVAKRNSSNSFIFLVLVFYPIPYY